MKAPLVPFLLGVLVGAAAADEFPARPDGAENFVLDEALLLEPRDEHAVNGVCRRLLAEEGVPILVVTIPSLAYYKSNGPIERYARSLFDRWGIGSPDRNLGMLLLVARGDRRARIELGAGWGRGHDDDAREIMQELIIPRFKRGRFGEGVVSGVGGLDRLARGQPVVRGGGPNWFRVSVVLSVIALLVFIVWRASRDAKRTARWTSRRHRRSSDWRKRQAYRDQRDLLAYGINSAGTGGWSGSAGGGSFGGGFSGGGGATGSW